MYCIELTVKLSPMPLVVQRKEHGDAKRLYSEVIDSIKKGNQRLLELSCEKVEDKRITVLVSEITAVQIYEKTSSSTSKRPGFSLQNWEKIGVIQFWNQPLGLAIWNLIKSLFLGPMESTSLINALFQFLNLVCGCWLVKTEVVKAPCFAWSMEEYIQKAEKFSALLDHPWFIKTQTINCLCQHVKVS